MVCILKIYNFLWSFNIKIVTLYIKFLSFYKNYNFVSILYVMIIQKVTTSSMKFVSIFLKNFLFLYEN